MIASVAGTTSFIRAAARCMYSYCPAPRQAIPDGEFHVALDDATCLLDEAPDVPVGDVYINPGGRHRTFGAYDHRARDGLDRRYLPQWNLRNVTSGHRDPLRRDHAG